MSATVDASGEASGRESRPAGLDGFGDLAALEAAGAHVSPRRGALEEDPDALEVGIEAALGRDHRVRTMVAEGRLLPTDCANLAHCGGQCSWGRVGRAKLCLRAALDLLGAGACPQP